MNASPSGVHTGPKWQRNSGGRAAPWAFNVPHCVWPPSVKPGHNDRVGHYLCGDHTWGVSPLCRAKWGTRAFIPAPLIPCDLTPAVRSEAKGCQLRSWFPLSNEIMSNFWNEGHTVVRHLESSPVAAFKTRSIVK